MAVEDLFNIRVLTTAINEMQTPEMRIFNKLYRPKAHMEVSDKLMFEIITAGESILGTISIYAPATVISKTGRKVITMEAPRLAPKEFIHTSEMNAMRAYGEGVAVELLKNRIARELKNERNTIDRTLEFWSATTLQGKIVDADGTTLLDYNLATAHKPTANPLWTAANHDIMLDLRTWIRLINKDAKVGITSFMAYVGYEVMDAMLADSAVRELLRYDKGSQIAESGRIARLVNIDMDEYTATYVDAAGTTKYYVDSKHLCLIGMGPEVFDCPYAPIVDQDAPGGVGNPGAGQMYFAKSWDEKDPSGRWIKSEARPLPVLAVPGAIVYAKCV